MKKAGYDYGWDIVANILMILFVLSFLFNILLYHFFPETHLEVYEFSLKDVAIYLTYGSVVYLLGICRLFFRKKISIFTILLPAILLILWLRQYISEWSFYADSLAEGFGTVENLNCLRIVLLFNIICSALLCIGFIWHRIAFAAREKM